MQCYDIANVIAMIEAMIWVGPIATSGWLLFPLGCDTVRGRHLHIIIPHYLTIINFLQEELGH